jgi:FkbM family methyltransferase
MISIIKKIIHKLITRPFKAYILKDAQLVAHSKWLKDKGDKVLRLEYPLNKNSVVFDLGGYKGEFSENIYNKYNCTVYVFEPVSDFFKIIKDKFTGNNKIHMFNYGLSSEDNTVEISLADDGSSTYQQSNTKEIIQLKSISDFINENNIKNIDLLKINIEGGEFDILPELIRTDFVRNIDDIQVQFHNFVDDAIKKREHIRNGLSKTHNLSYDYYFVWENWRKKI